MLLLERLLSLIRMSSKKRFCTPYPPSPPVENWRIFKLNDVSLYVSNPTAVDNVLTYCKGNGFNWIQFYGLYSVFGTGLEADLALMIEAAYATGTILRVGAIMGAGTAGFSAALNYNSTVVPNQQFNDMNKENEFWRYPSDPAAESSASWLASMVWLRAQINGLSYPCVNSAYIQDYVPSVWPAGVTLQMIQAEIDYLETTNYTTTPDELAVRNSLLSQLGNAAISNNTIQKFNNLFSAEAGFMGPYFGTNGLAASFGSWTSQYAADSFSGKNGLLNTGVNVFSYNDLSAYIP